MIGLLPSCNFAILAGLLIDDIELIWLSCKFKKVKSFNVMSFPTIILSKGKTRVEFTKDRENMDDFHEFFKENDVKIVWM